MPIGLTVGLTDTIVSPNSVCRLSKVLKALDRPVLLITDELGGHATSLKNAVTAMKFMLDNTQNRIK
jgi:hypothetical protein